MVIMGKSAYSAANLATIPDSYDMCSLTQIAQKHILQGVPATIRISIPMVAWRNQPSMMVMMNRQKWFSIISLYMHCIAYNILTPILYVVHYMTNRKLFKIQHISMVVNYNAIS